MRSAFKKRPTDPATAIVPAGVVLVGGRSTRMGKNKALLPFHGRPLVEHMTALLRHAGLETLYLSGTLQGYDTIPDQAPARGPLGGIDTVARAALQQDIYTHLLVVPVDMPRLRPTLLSGLYQSTAARRGEAAVHYADHPFPLLLRLSPFVLAALERATRAEEAAERAVQRLLADLRAVPLPRPNNAREGHFTNLNTLAEWLRDETTTQPRQDHLSD